MCWELETLVLGYRAIEHAMWDRRSSPIEMSVPARADRHCQGCPESLTCPLRTTPLPVVR